MSALLTIAGLFMAFQACVGFLFGQLFAGHFSPAATLTGGAGVACAMAALRMATQGTWTARWVRWAAVCALAGVALDVADYYLYLDIPGNYYPWFLVVPFIACIGLVAGVEWQRGAASAAGILP